MSGEPTMLKPGDKATPFDLSAAIDGRIERVTLAAIRSEMIVLFFYPRDFSFVCPTEIIGFGKRLAQFTAEKTSVLGASLDSAESHRDWARELGGVYYPLLADQGGRIARAYGVLDDTRGVALRATFVIDSKRNIAYSLASPVNVGRNVDETLRVVQAIRSGQLCPSEWRPGDSFGPSELDF
ncbi:MAG: peroxiredoxin [Candidatus Binataceae bacterium]